MLFMWIPWCHQLLPQQTELGFKVNKKPQGSAKRIFPWITLARMDFTLLHQQSINPHPQLWHPQGEKTSGSAEGRSRNVESLLLLQCVHYTGSHLQKNSFLCTKILLIHREKVTSPLIKIPHEDNSAAEPWRCCWVALEDKFLQQ